MATFAFALKQRVIVPNSNDTQGVITGRSEYVDREPEYEIQAITPEGRPVKTTALQREIFPA